MYQNYKWKYALIAVLTALAVWGLAVQPPNLGLDLRGGAQLIYRLQVQEKGWVGMQVRKPKASDKDKIGLYVSTVQPDSPAEKAGLRMGDIIKEVDGAPQDSEITFQQYVLRQRNKTIKVKYKSLKADKVIEKDLKVSTRSKSQTRLAENVIEVLKKRLDGFGLKEMNIQRQGSSGIIIEVPGGGSEEIKRIEDVVSRGGKLAFKIVIDDRIPDVSASKRDQEIKRIFGEKRRGDYVEDDPYDIAYSEAALKAAKRTVESLTEAEAPNFYVLLRNPGVSGEYLSNAYPTSDRAGRPAIGFSWGPVGSKKFDRMTSQNLQKTMAVVLDGALQQQATIQAAISSSGIIEGNFSDDEIRGVVVVLKGGALQAKPVLQSKVEVGPSIGRASLKIGQYAIFAATLLVLAFMFMFYKGSGLIANVALILNLVLILGTLTIFEAALTLPGIAGILLTAGMAVDANILIFERIREELEKEASIKQSIQAGYDRAFWTIFDANITTLITAFILFKAGTGPIKGFAVTLMVGIMCSLFTALFVTKAIYGFMVSNEYIHEMKMAKVLDKTNIDFMSMRGKWGRISLIAINIGFFIFCVRGVEKYGLDFTGGTMLETAVHTSMSTQEVEEQLSAKGLENFTVTRTGIVDKNDPTKGYFFQIKTRQVAEDIKHKGDEKKDDADEKAPKAQDLFRKDVEAALNTKLIESIVSVGSKRWEVLAVKQQESSNKVDPKLCQIRFGVVVQRPDALSDYQTPTADSIQKAVRTVKVKEFIEGSTVTLKDDDKSKPYMVFTITSGKRVPNHAKGQKKAFDAIMKALEDDKSIDTARNFSRVTAIGASIAYNLKSKALISLFFSLIAIILYITIRFEFRFGVAAITALIHDVLFTLGFMALLDAAFTSMGLPFDVKINLPTIAAFLTIIGYSLNDTIVVFDRIRENLGMRKLKGKEFDEIVNLSINQTLSRTILTSLTTFFVVFVLFGASFFGLNSIQGLSVALMVGVIVGTYSSIFVAASVLVQDSDTTNRLYMMQGAALIAIFIAVRFMA